MTIQNLPDEELSKWIAEFIEPKPAWKYADSEHEDVGICWMNSDGGCYQRMYIDGKVDLEQPCSATDPAMTLMLLEKLAEYGSKYNSETNLSYSPALKTWCASIDGIVGVGRKDLGRAIAEAFALANGYKET